MDKLTLVAALPQGGGCQSSLPPEKNETPPKVQMKAPYFDFPELSWPTIVFLGEEPAE